MASKQILVNLDKKTIIFTEDYIDENPDFFLIKGCNNCHNENTELFKCGKCKCVYYCSKECQKQDWKLHKPNCKIFNDQFTYKTSKKGCMFISNAFDLSANVIKRYFNVKKNKYWQMKLNEDHILVEKMDFETMEYIKKANKELIELLKDPNKICFFERNNAILSVCSLIKIKV